MLCTLVDSIISFDLLDALVNSVFVSTNSWLLIRRSHCLQCPHRTDMNGSLVAYARHQFLIDSRWASSCAIITSALGTVWTRTVDCCFAEATAYEVALCQRHGSLVAYARHRSLRSRWPPVAPPSLLLRGRMPLAAPHRSRANSCEIPIKRQCASACHCFAAFAWSMG